MASDQKQELTKIAVGIVQFEDILKNGQYKIDCLKPAWESLRALESAREYLNKLIDKL